VLLERYAAMMVLVLGLTAVRSMAAGAGHFARRDLRLP
jgi:hypothetical protein